MRSILAMKLGEGKMHTYKEIHKEHYFISEQI